MDIPELAKKTETQVKADAAHAETTVNVDFIEAKSWFQENKEPVIFIAAACLILGALVGYWALKLLR